MNRRAAALALRDCQVALEGLGDALARLATALEAGTGQMLPPIERTLALVSDYYGVPEHQIQAYGKQSERAHARWCVWYLVHEVFGLSCAELARQMGGRDPATVTHGVANIRALMASDPRWASDMELLTKRLREEGA